MNLDDYGSFATVDVQNRIRHINQLPDHLESAWTVGQSLPLPDPANLHRIVLAGVGASATSAGLAAACAAHASSIPVIQQSGYVLPSWCRGVGTLLVALSHSGDAEETSAVVQQARAAGCSVLVLAAPGPLTQQAHAQGLPVWDMENSPSTGASIGSSLGLLLALLQRLGALSSAEQDLREALHALRNLQTTILPETLVRFNAAKRIAGQLMNRWVTIVASDQMGAVAKYWADQFNTLAKAWSQYVLLPEGDHTTLVGLNHPEPGLSQMVALFLTAPANHPRVQERLELTRRAYMVQGINTDFIAAKGEGLLANLLTLAHFADYTAYYLAMAYHEDPSQAQIIQDLKDYLRDL